MMFKIKLILILFVTLIFSSAIATAADIVRLEPYGDYPIPMGSLENSIEGKSYMIPNGTKAKVIEWHKKYSLLGEPFARIDMYNKSRVKILNGPLKGKELYVAHIYITME